MTIRFKHAWYVLIALNVNCHASEWVKEGVKSELITPLMRLAKNGDVAHLEGMLRSKENINAQSESGMTALHYALGFGKEAAAISLIKAGADVHVLDKWGNTALSMARANNNKSVIAVLERKILSRGFSGATLPNNDKHFIILVASFNNARWYRRNLDSIFSQTYEKYTVVYMDDLSTDGTFELVQSYVGRKAQNKNVILVKNTDKKYCLGNYLWAIERFCPDNAILVTLDGDDWFSGSGVLAYLNNVYQDPLVWMTYGESKLYPRNVKTRHCRPISARLFARKGALRKKCQQAIFWPVHHLRSFYTWLFRRIRTQDFLDDEGKLFTYAEDVAYMLPMLEMSGMDHHKYLSKILYIYNQENPLITANVIGTQVIQDKFLSICAKPSYGPIVGSAMVTGKKQNKHNRKH